MGCPVPIDEILAMEQESNFEGRSLGKLASCFMDGLASVGVPSVGYGLRNELDEAQSD